MIQTLSLRRVKAQAQNYFLKSPLVFWFIVFTRKGPGPQSFHARMEENPRALDWEGSLDVFVSRLPREYPT